MNTPDPRLHSLWFHVKTGMAVGLVFCFAFGFVNALLVLGGTATWVKQFVQGDVIPQAARDSLLRSTPIFAISTAAHGALGLLLGGIWGSLLGLGLKVRARFPRTPVDNLSVHLASFFAFPMFLLTLLALLLLRSTFVKHAPPLTLPRLLLSLVLLLALSYLVFRIGRWLLRRLLTVQPFRFAVSGRGFAVLTVGYLVFIALVSYLPPALASRKIGPGLTLTSGGNPDAGAPRPNVLLIVLDTTRADHLSCYGYPKPTTPFLESFAREGVLFAQAYSPAVWTLAGHASIFTSLVPSKSGANGEHIYLEESFVTLAELLQASGYRTAGFSNNAWVSEFTGMDQGFDHYRKMWLKPYGTNFLVAHGLLRAVEMLFKEVQPPGGVEETTAEALKWLGDGGKKPFFLFLNLMEAHPPLDYRPEFTGPFLPPGASPEELKRVNQNPYSVWARKATMSERESACYQALYDGELRYLDDRLGKFFARLRFKGLMEDTLVIITADHGELLGEAGSLGHHFSVGEALLRVPLIIRYPKCFPAGVRHAERVQTLDILPTVLGVLGIREPALWGPLQGQALCPLPGRRESGVFAEEFRPLLEIKFVKAYQPEFNVDEVYAHHRRAWVEGDYKYTNCEDGSEALYDIVRDPGETRNLAGSNPAIVARMRGRLKDWLATYEPFAIKREDYRFQPDKATEEQLRSLGYIQ